MNSKLKSQISLFVFGAVIALAAGAQAYTASTGTPSTFNTEPPINIGNTDQVKDGSLSVNAFNAQGKAMFNQHVQVVGSIRGGNPGDAVSTVKFGGTDASGTFTTDVKVSGEVRAGDAISSGSLVQPGNPRPLCADANGIIIQC